MSNVVFRRIGGRIVPIRASAGKAQAESRSIQSAGRKGALIGLGIGAAVGTVMAARTPMGGAAVRNFAGAARTAYQVAGLHILRPVHLSVVGGKSFSMARRIGIRSKMASRIIKNGLMNPGSKAIGRVARGSLYGAAIGSVVGQTARMNALAAKRKST